MAIFHCQIKTIQRSKGRTAVAAAAYRSASALVDERTGEIHDYTRKAGVINSAIVMPDGCDWRPTQSELWNAAEAAEKRKDGNPAREHEIALPDELTAEQRRMLVESYAKDLASRHGCAVDWAIHAPSKEGDERNFHAHVLTTTRKVSGHGLGEKCEREKAGRSRANDVKVERQRWEHFANVALAEAGVEARVDHRSHAERGLLTPPSEHLGVAAIGFERRTGQKSRKRERIELAAEEAEIAAWRQEEDRLLTAEDPLVEFGIAQARAQAPVLDREAQRQADAAAAERYRELARQEMLDQQRSARDAWQRKKPMLPQEAQRQYDALAHQLELVNAKAQRHKPLPVLSLSDVLRIDAEVMAERGEPERRLREATQVREAFEAKIKSQWIPRPGDKARLAELVQLEDAARARVDVAKREVSRRENQFRDERYEREMTTWKAELEREAAPLRAGMAKFDPEKAKAAFSEWQRAKPLTPTLDAAEAAEKAEKAQQMAIGRQRQQQQTPRQMELDDEMDM